MKKLALTASLLSACAPGGHLAAPPGATTTVARPKATWTVSVVTLAPELPHVPERAVVTTTTSLAREGVERGVPATGAEPRQGRNAGSRREAAGAPPPSAPPMGRVVPNDHLAAIRRCESGGDYGAVSSNGHYRGAYQFDAATHRSVGGDGNAADDTPAQQDAAAQRLYNKRGASPWPVCGR